jgi:hypothetical protein
MSEDLYAEILSVADIQSPDALAAIGRAIDAFPEFGPTHIGRRDPPRTPVDRLEAALREWAPTIHPGDYFNQFLSRRGKPPPAWGLFWITGDIWNFPPVGAHKLELGVDLDWFQGPESVARLARFEELFTALVEASDAFWAGAGITSLRRQTNDFVREAKAAGTLIIPGIPGTGWDLREHALPDVYWLNAFGPAFVERWDAKLGGLGVRQRRTSNGGVIVVAAETPFLFDAEARRMTDYAWKRAFYDRLGSSAILHEHWPVQRRGAVVPTYEEHRTPRR